MLLDQEHRADKPSAMSWPLRSWNARFDTRGSCWASGELPDWPKDLEGSCRLWDTQSDPEQQDWVEFA